MRDRHSTLIHRKRSALESVWWLANAEAALKDPEFP